MPEDQDPQHDDAENGGDEQNPNLRQLRNKAKRADELEPENATLRKELAFARAGVDVETPLGKLLFKSYDGDLTADAVKAEATAVGALVPAAPKGDPIPDDERQSSDERSRLAAGGSADDFKTPDVDPRKAAVEAGRKALADGATEEVALSATFDSLVSAAAGGDKRVIWDPFAS